MAKKIGIWGLGVVGKSVIKYFYKYKYDLEILDKRKPTEQEKEFLQNYNVNYIPENSDQDIIEFIERNNFVVPSPGIDIKFYKNNSNINKLIAELDIFCSEWKKPIIAVTGTIGKTSVVHLLSKILEHYGKHVITGGNIGFGMLDLIEFQDNYDMAILELSSFQLEYITHFTPTIALWTNFYPNHLDRHDNLINYFQAKYNIIKYQNHEQVALLPWEIQDKIISKAPERSFNFFSCKPLNNTELQLLRPQDTLYLLESNGKIKKYNNNSSKTLFNSLNLPELSYKSNWLTLIALCDILNFNLEQLLHLPSLDLPDHRLNHIATVNKINFYNDSKSTIFQATLAAVDQLKNHNIYLFLGGISKGIDRIPFIEQLQNKVQTILCFGAEAKELYQECLRLNINAYCYDTLDQAFSSCISLINPGDTVLFSPSGASYDLFKNYEERGKYFVSLVNKFKQQDTV